MAKRSTRSIASRRRAVLEYFDGDRLHDMVRSVCSVSDAPLDRWETLKFKRLPSRLASNCQWQPKTAHIWQSKISHM